MGRLTDELTFVCCVHTSAPLAHRMSSSTVWTWRRSDCLEIPMDLFLLSIQLLSPAEDIRKRYGRLVVEMTWMR